MIRHNQFSLGSLFVATAIVALACAAAFWPREPVARLLCWLTVPPLLAAAVGVIRGRNWLIYGVGIDIAIGGMILAWLLAWTS